METINKIIELIRELLPTFIGWFVAKQDNKIDVLKEENEKLKEWKEIDEKIINDTDIYDSNTWK